MKPNVLEDDQDEERSERDALRPLSGVYMRDMTHHERFSSVGEGCGGAERAVLGCSAGQKTCRHFLSDKVLHEARHAGGQGKCS